ncbi:MAG: hypothetical protein RL757_3374 [Bacteroidota bacterium]|jgi:gliding motility-associated-like protein
MKKLLPIFIFLLSFPTLYGQIDSTFWFAVPDATDAHGDRPILLRLSSVSSNVARIMISQPANAGFAPIVISLRGFETQSVDLTPFIDQLENRIPNVALNQGLKIQSDQPITAYYELNHQGNPEMFVLKGKNALGKTFYTPFQNLLRRWYSAFSSFDIVATEANTRVVITPAVAVDGHTGGVPFVVILQAGQTYSVRTIPETGFSNTHLSGSKIVADKPIAVTTKDDSVEGSLWGGCADMCGDQILPTSLIGNEYIAVKGNLAGADKIFVLATRANTQIFVDGNPSPVATIGEGQTFSFDLSNASAYIRSSEPVYVSHLSGLGCELGMPNLPPVKCTGSKKVTFSRPSNDFFAVTIIAPNGLQNSFTLNGFPLPNAGSAFRIVPGTNDRFVAAKIDMTNTISVGTSAIIANAQGKFHVGIINAATTSGTKFGYFSDYSYEVIDTNIAVCTGQNFRRPNGALASAVGIYEDTIRSADACTYIQRTHLSFLPLPVVSLGNDTTICYRQSILLNAQHANRIFSWNTGGVGQTLLVNASGNYRVTVTDNFGCRGSDTIQVTVAPRIQTIATTTSNFNGSPISCKGKNDGAATAQSSYGVAPYTYKWSNGVGGATVNNLSAGVYRLTTTDNRGCKDSSATLNVTEPNAIAAILEVPTAICEGNNDGKIILSSLNGGIPNYQFSLNNQPLRALRVGDTIQDLSAKMHVLQVKDTNNCIANFQTTIRSVVKLRAEIEGDSVFLLGDSIKLTAIANPSSRRIAYAWSPLDTGGCAYCETVTVSPLIAKNYQVVLKDQYGCTTTQSKTVRPSLDGLLFIPKAFSPNNDGTNDRLMVFGTAGVRVIKRFEVFNRWGNRLYVAENFLPNDDSRGWDGTFLSQRQDLNVVVWTLSATLIDGTNITVSGTSTLLQ